LNKLRLNKEFPFGLPQINVARPKACLFGILHQLSIDSAEIFEFLIFFLEFGAKPVPQIVDEGVHGLARAGLDQIPEPFLDDIVKLILLFLIHHYFAFSKIKLQPKLPQKIKTPQEKFQIKPPTQNLALSP
jgi:hypothetical protein